MTNITISTGTILRAVFILLAFWFLFAVKDMVVMLLAAVIVAAAIEPIADRMAKYRIPRAVTVVVVYLLVILLLIGVGALMADPLVEQTRALAAAVPEVVSRFSGLSTVVPEFDQQQVIDAVQQGLGQFGNNLANISINIFASTRTLINNLVNFLFVFVIALYLVTEQDALKKFARLIVSKKHINRVEKSLDRVHRSLGKWVLAQLTLGVSVGLIVGLGLWVLGVPYALLLGILSALLEFIPVIGPILSAIPGILVALAQSWVLAVVVWVFYVIVGQVEGQVLIPNIMKRAVGLKPLITIIAVLVGARLFGVVGILLAVPVAVVIKVFVEDLVWGEELNQE